MNVNSFKENGYIVIENFLDIEDVQKIKDICLSIKRNIIDNDLLGKPKSFGFETYWRGVDMASTQSTTLFEYYTSKKMYDMASQLLETKDIHIFNDQIVIKLPKEDFAFSEHTDNQYGPNNEKAKMGVFKTITCCLVLDDFTLENGPVSILNNRTRNWDTPLPKKGDLVVWNGNTFHKSNNNESESERSVWLCVYSTTDLTKIIPEEPNTFSKFYGQKFLL
jgi:ectoine hydroxylase-related dioxygenase (phytanoyl-CoA dioxygenase family)